MSRKYSAKQTLPWICKKTWPVHLKALIIFNVNFWTLLNKNTLVKKDRSYARYCQLKNKYSIANKLLLPQFTRCTSLYIIHVKTSLRNIEMTHKVKIAVVESRQSKCILSRVKKWTGIFLKQAIKAFCKVS